MTNSHENTAAVNEAKKILFAEVASLLRERHGDKLLVTNYNSVAVSHQHLNGTPNGQFHFVPEGVTDTDEHIDIRLDVRQWGDTPFITVNIGYGKKDKHRSSAKKPIDAGLIVLRMEQEVESVLRNRKLLVTRKDTRDRLIEGLKAGGVAVSDSGWVTMPGVNVEISQSGHTKISVSYGGDEVQEILAVLKLLSQRKQEVN